MTNKEILTAVIIKGLKYSEEEAVAMIDILSLLEGKRYYELIFGHTFLKAFFGEEIIHVYNPTFNGKLFNKEGVEFNNNHARLEIVAWMFHGDILLTSEDKLRYLSNFI